MDYIHISTLNDFTFCPYSIYLHNVYMETDEMVYVQSYYRCFMGSKSVIHYPIFELLYMLVISYDIKDDKVRTRFSKMLTRNGAIRLQYSVYEINNTERVMKNLLVLIEDKFSKEFGGDDSVIIFDVSSVKLKKYGNAIHRDQDVVYF